MVGRKEVLAKLDEIVRRLDQIDRESELLRTVLVVKEPETVKSVSAYEGLRKQVIASSGERRSHLAQLTSIAVALSRASTPEDLRPQVDEWLQQAGIVQLYETPVGGRVQDYFDDLDGGNLEDAERIEVLEPAYVDVQNKTMIRLGRARRVQPSQAAPVASGRAADVPSGTAGAVQAPTQKPSPDSSDQGGITP